MILNKMAFKWLWYWNYTRITDYINLEHISTLIVKIGMSSITSIEIGLLKTFQGLIRRVHFGVIESLHGAGGSAG